MENAIQHTQNTALKGRRFDSIEQQNEFLEQWEQRWAAQRIHGREKRQVQAMFEEERPTLTPLPVMRFALFKDLIRTVCDDTTVRVDNSNYAARPAAIGAKVLVRLYTHLVEIRDLSSQQLIRTHVRSERAGAVVLPDDERPFNPSRQTGLLFKLSRDIGPGCLQLCQDWFAKEGRVGQRRMWGLVGLANKHAASLVEQACQQALRAGLTTLKAVTTIVHQLSEQESRDQLSLLPTLTQQHELIRGAQHYADFFAMASSAAAGRL